jgi:hypothetical protein
MTRQKWLVLAAVLLLVGATIGAVNHVHLLQKMGPPGLKLIEAKVYDTATNVIGTVTVPLPPSVLTYTSRVLPITVTEVSWLPKDTTFARRLYEASNAPSLMLSVILMGSDRGSIHQPQICLAGQGFQIEKQEITSIPVARPHPYDLPVMKVTAGKKARTKEGREITIRALYVYWFVAENQLTVKHGDRMWSMAKQLLRTGTLQRWAYVACFSQCLPGEEDAAYEVIKRFIAAATPEFQLAAGPLSAPSPTR